MRRRRDGGGADATRWMRDDVDEANDASDARFGVVDADVRRPGRERDARARSEDGLGEEEDGAMGVDDETESDDDDDDERESDRRRRRGRGRGREGW